MVTGTITRTITHLSGWWSKSARSNIIITLFFCCSFGTKNTIPPKRTNEFIFTGRSIFTVVITCVNRSISVIIQASAILLVSTIPAHQTTAIFINIFPWISRWRRGRFTTRTFTTRISICTTVITVFVGYGTIRIILAGITSGAAFGRRHAYFVII